MNKLKRKAGALMALFLVMTTAVSCNNKENTSSEGSSDNLFEIPSEPEIIDDPSDISGEYITWLADYDLNPQCDDERSVALAIFEDYYGASVDFVYTSPEDKYNRLSEMINGGEEVDMFPYEQEAFPEGVKNELFEPLDPYFDIMGVDEDDLWDDMISVCDMLEYDGMHYVMPYSLSSPELLTYDRKFVEDEGLEDPYELYRDGKWNRDKLMSMMKKFVKNAEDGQKRYGICGSFGKAAMQSSGHTVVGYDGKSFTNNIKDDEIKKAAEFMSEIYSNGLYSSKWHDRYPNDGSVLFYAMSDWSLGRSNESSPDNDLMIVPFPKAKGAEKNYVTCNADAKMLVKGSEKGNAVAIYMRCERLAASKSSYTKAAREKMLSDERRPITAEQCDALESFIDPREVTPVFDPAYGMGERLYGSGDFTFESRGVMDNLTTVFLDGSRSFDSWDELCDMWSDIIDDELKNY